MTRNLYILESHKFTNDNVEATFVCPKCDGVFIKGFPLDREGQIIEFKCPVCKSSNEADLPLRKLMNGKTLKEILSTLNKRTKKDLRMNIDVVPRRSYEKQLLYTPPLDSDLDFIFSLIQKRTYDFAANITKGN